MLTDGRTDGRTDGKPDPYIAPCLRQARQKVIGQMRVIIGKNLIVSNSKNILVKGPRMTFTVTAKCHVLIYLTIYTSIFH